MCLVFSIKKARTPYTKTTIYALYAPDVFCDKRSCGSSLTCDGGKAGLHVCYASAFLAVNWLSHIILSPASVARSNCIYVLVAPRYAMQEALDRVHPACFIFGKGSPRTPKSVSQVTSKSGERGDCFVIDPPPLPLKGAATSNLDYPLLYP